jgi:hypothetical protein
MRTAGLAIVLLAGCTTPTADRTFEERLLGRIPDGVTIRWADISPDGTACAWVEQQEFGTWATYVNGTAREVTKTFI